MMIKHLAVLCQFLSILGGVLCVLVANWSMAPIAVCLLLGFVMWKLHLDGVEGWWVAKDLDIPNWVKKDLDIPNRGDKLLIILSGKKYDDNR